MNIRNLINIFTLLLLTTSRLISIELEKSFLTQQPLGSIAVAHKLDIDIHAEIMLNRTFNDNIALHWYNCGYSGGGKVHNKGGAFGDFGLHVPYSKRAERYPRAVRTSETQLCRFDGNDSMKANFTAEKEVTEKEDFTLEVWVKDSNPQKNEVILGWESQKGDTTSAPLLYPTQFIGSSKWQHIVVNCKENNESWYLNGAKISSGQRKMFIKEGHYMVLGGSSWATPSFKGDLAVVRLHEKSLTSEEVLHNFKGGVKLGCKLVSWWRTDKEKWWIQESEHYRHCIDKKEMEKWSTDTMKKFRARVPEMFKLAEKAYRLYSENLGLRVGVVSSLPKFRGDGIKYKIPIQPTDGGNYMGWDGKRGFGWSCQAPGYFNPHEMVHGCQGQTGHMQGNYWEAHANFPQTYMGIYQTVPPTFASRVSMFFPCNGRVFYHARTMFEHLAQTPEYGPLFISKLWYDSGTKKTLNEYPWLAFKRFDPDPSTSFEYEWTRMVQRCVTWDFKIFGDAPKDIYTRDARANADQILRHGRTLLYPDLYDKGWFRPSMGMAPQQLGWNICPLEIKSKTVTLELKGFLNKQRGSDWRAAFVAVNKNGKPQYGEVTSPGDKTTFKLNPNSKKLYLVVSAVPKKLMAINMTGDFKSFEKERFHYKVKLSGCTPLQFMIPKKSKIPGSRHKNGGGFVASSASVDKTVYVGPNAQVLGNSKVLGNARIEGYAIVKDSAIVQDFAQVSDFAVISDSAIIRDYARIRDYATVCGKTIVRDNARVLEHAYTDYHCKEVSNDAVIKGVAYAHGKISGTAIVDGSYCKSNTLDKGVWLTWSWGKGQNDGEHEIELGGLYAQYLFETDHPYLAKDTFGVSNGIIHGSPLRRQYTNREKFKTYTYKQSWQHKKNVELNIKEAGTSIVLNGKDQFIEIPKALADLRNMTISFTFKTNGGKPNQRLFEFAYNKHNRIILTPFSGNGKPVFAIQNNGRTQTLRPNVTIKKGKWTTLKVSLKDDIGIMQIDGKTVAKNKIDINPEDIKAKYCSIGRGLEGNYFWGEIEDISIYRTAVYE